MTGIFIRKGDKTQIQRHTREELHVTTATEIEGSRGFKSKPRNAKECLQTTGSWDEVKRVPLQVSKNLGPADTLILSF